MRHAEPSFIGGNAHYRLPLTQVTFSTLGLCSPLLRTLELQGYSAPTPIQAQAIPVILDGGDVLGIAQTGTGKTAAFSLPLLQRLYANPHKSLPKCTRSLILAPTRELAIQIADSVRTYGQNLGLRTAVVVGGVGINPQIRALERGIDIVIATPGRLLDLLGQKHIRLDHVENIVIDEADRMFDMGFLKDVRRIVGEIPMRRQALLFSATMPSEVAELAGKMLRNPTRVEVSPWRQEDRRIEQVVYPVEQPNKVQLLLRILGDASMDKVILFARTKHGANKITDKLLKAEIASAAIHGNKSQGARQRALEEFRNSKIRVLVATDIAARGIDIDDVSHVVNFDLPDVAENYVHRIGRTARGGATGKAITLCSIDETPLLRAVEKTIAKTLPQMTDHPFAVELPQGRGNAPVARSKPRNNAPQKPKGYGHVGKEKPAHAGSKSGMPRSQQRRSRTPRAA